MDSFLIKLIANEIAVYENEDDRFVPLKHRGEEIQTYKEDSFWNWWKEKIEYDGRAMNFVVITDREEFVIPENISICENNSFMEIAHIKRRLSDLSKGYNIFFFPKVENFEITPTVIKKKKIAKKENISIKEDSLLSYFRRKTDEYKN